VIFDRFIRETLHQLACQGVLTIPNLLVSIFKNAASLEVAITGRGDMKGVVDSAEITDCGSVTADVAARYAFLKAVSHLPHFEVLPKPGIDLSHTIEAEIIPRLILAHRNDEGRRSAGASTTESVTPTDLKDFSEIILVGRIDEALAMVAALSARGVSVESIMLDLLAPVATKLGEMWENDSVDFLSVTVSLGYLQQVLRHLSGNLQTFQARGMHSHKVLLSAVPGETHIFSLLLVDQFFRGDGWNTWTLPGATRDELVDIVGREAFALVGLSISCDVCIAELGQLIPAIRRASKNKSLRIMIGGPIFKGRPQFALELGADGTAGDGATALIEALRIVENQR
jgi:methanogenic corrinoid protein MtbC1